MKKTLLALAILVGSTGVFAQAQGLKAPVQTDPVGFVTYDYDRGNDNQGPYSSMHEVHVGAAYATKYGTFDGAVVGRQLVSRTRDDNYGFEFGYSKAVKFNDITVTGRAAVGRVNLVDAGGAGFIGNTQYYSLAAEASKPLTTNVTGFVGYRFRDAFNGTGPVQNRFIVGADVELTKAVSVRAGYAFTKQNGRNYNGLTTAVFYKF